MQEQRQHSKNNGRILYLSGEISELVAQEVNIEMLRMQREDPLEDITMIIDTYGGDMFASFAIVDMMELITCDIRTICVGKAFSAGQFIFSTGAKGKRFMTKHARLMLHSPIAGMQGSVPDIEIEIEEIQRSRDQFVTHISQRSNLSQEDVNEMIQRNAYLDVTKAIEMGFADAVINKLK
jgi:ATP-dependent Clp protease protease subunit